MSLTMLEQTRQQLQQIESEGLLKRERPIDSPQNAWIDVRGKHVLNLCANNYLGLADDPRLIAAAKQALDQWGFGMASVRFICGTQSLHRTLEQQLSQFLATDDTILYSSCFDANGGLFETLLTDADAIISDELNHASIIDGVRLCKAKRYRYRNNDMADLETQLKQSVADGCRYRMIATDGVFSMDGVIANLPGICELADQYDALVMVDDSHAVGFMGDHGGGTPDHHHVRERIDILTGTLGKALGGASGGYVSGRQPFIDLLRQRSRPYLFSNSLAPMLVAASIEAVKIAGQSAELRQRLRDNTQLWRTGLTERGFTIVPGEHPIVPIMIGDAAAAARFADALFQRGIYVVGFSFPVVPRGKARLRTQLSAAHQPDDLRNALDTFAAVRDELMTNAQ